MATQKQDGLFTDTAESSADLTGKEFHFCTLGSDGTVALSGSGAVINGVISQGRAIGYQTSFNTGGGWLKVVAGGTIAINANVQSDANGQATSGSTNSFGKARNAVVAGEFVEVVPDRV